jgi:hypothetical protein
MWGIVSVAERERTPLATLFIVSDRLSLDESTGVFKTLLPVLWATPLVPSGAGEVVRSSDWKNHILG